MALNFGHTSCALANIKQVLTILLSVSLFHLTITLTNALGIGLTLLGGAWYAAIEYRERERARGRVWT